MQYQCPKHSLIALDALEFTCYATQLQQERDLLVQKPQVWAPKMKDAKNLRQIWLKPASVATVGESTESSVSEHSRDDSVAESYLLFFQQILIGRLELLNIVDIVFEISTHIQLMIQEPITLDQFFGTNFKRVTLLYGQMEGTNPFEINETDEDQESELASRQQKRPLPPVRVDRKMVERARARPDNSRSPVHQQQFEGHIGFRNSFYRNNKLNLGSRQRIQELKSKEAGLFTKYAQRFNALRSPGRH